MIRRLREWIGARLLRWASSLWNDDLVAPALGVRFLAEIVLGRQVELVDEEHA